MQVFMPLLVTKGTELSEDRVLPSVQPECMSKAVIGDMTAGCDDYSPLLIDQLQIIVVVWLNSIRASLFLLVEAIGGSWNRTAPS
jgi:hypothetical protein